MRWERSRDDPDLRRLAGPRPEHLRHGVGVPHAAHHLPAPRSLATALAVGGNGCVEWFGDHVDDCAGGGIPRVQQRGGFPDLPLFPAVGDRPAGIARNGLVGFRNLTDVSLFLPSPECAHIGFDAGDRAGQVAKENDMPQTITKGAKELVAEANSQITTIPVDEAMGFVGSDTHVIVDLRDHRELKRTGKIPGAFSCPRGMLEFWIDPDSPYHKDIFNQDKTYVFYCASAWRSALATLAAQEMGLAPVAHIDGGFTAWEKAGGPVEEIS